jgi:hypothetical protein
MPQKKTWRFETTCVDSDGPSINNMTRDARTVTYRTMQRVLGRAFRQVQAELGYDIGAQRGGLRMAGDFAVSYWKSTYRDRRCYYFVWSHIEHIFVEAT